MEDYSYLDRKYFLDRTTYNCPFCNRKNVPYSITHIFQFQWTGKKDCYGFITRCSYCGNHSMHLSFEELVKYRNGTLTMIGNLDIDIDSKIFYSVPTSFFTLDDRINAIIRELITEAEGCLKMNYLTGASACMRKAIYELLVFEKAEGADYESRIKFLKQKYPDTDPSYFDILSHIQGMTSDKIHEQSWDKWDSQSLQLIIETLKSILYEIYVLPEVKKTRSKSIQELLQKVKKPKGNPVPNEPLQS